ncbi:four-carbon acid sugar kinase family protein, partial [Escherichia coli]|uniref:four-carbon acid sugar kinase family protein n=1 Tax=Escherichia coli TaxID=562 RepID=UPI0032E49DD5
NILRLLASQTNRPIRLVNQKIIHAGTGPLRKHLDDLAAEGIRYAVLDAITTADLSVIGEACRDDVLLTGAAGLAGGVGRAIAGAGQAKPGYGADPVGAGRSVALAGSCSARTREQVAFMRNNEPSFFLDAVGTPDPEKLAASAVAWLDGQADDS